ncbi:MAG: UDP-N-acetylmuramoyl-tripeptide--D-alanyl-D-alanine ligase [Candidatus Pacebacteria bacterium]|nr:UDP-N-acetylmuramoyl-tripeptide--D-alanyl-D-alanine ligase [Candidatus Paceibacterota bacterium]MCF7857146.1 UDP-N-acetylmuramoyl-tripeptide--D-alanyl-D-alanine ligase [Candidatus Paceibacterota bacterium]
MKEFLKKIIIAILSFEAKILLRRTHPYIIAITGSVGKTSIKDVVYEILKDSMHVRKSEKSFNSEIGVPLSVLGLPNAWSNPFLWLKNIFDGAVIAFHPGIYPKTLILEMGVDRPGDMDRLTSWIRPDVVILSRLPDVPVHVEYFDSPEAVALEKQKLVNALKPDGVLVYNQDDERILKVVEETIQQSIGYSRYSFSPFTASADKVIYENGKAVGLEFLLTHLDKTVSMFVRGSLGVQHAYNYAAGAAVASVFNIDVESVKRALGDHLPPPGRMRLIQGIKDTLLIDDTYNSSPTASERALATLSELRGVKRRIAVMGDMMELGQFSIREHERIGRIVAKSADILVTIGVRARSFSKGAIEQGMSEKNIFEFEDALQAGKELQTFIKSGDVLLVKGSQSIRAERFVEELMAEPELAEDLLVRQDAMWKSI